MKRIFATACILLQLVSVFIIPSGGVVSAAYSEGQTEINGYILSFPSAVFKKQLKNLEQKQNKDVSKKIEGKSLVLIDEDKNVLDESYINELRRKNPLARVIPNYKHVLSSSPITNDPHVAKQYAINNQGQNINGFLGTVDADVDALEAWGLNNGGSEDVIVAVIDTGVLINHPDLRGSMWNGSLCKDQNGNFLGGCQGGYDFVENDKIPLPNKNEDKWYHGTFIAGIIAAQRNNGIGISGAAPRVRIMALRANDVFSDYSAISFATNNGAKVINASYGYFGRSVNNINDCIFAQNYSDVIRSFGGTFIAGAGNDGATRNLGSTTMVIPADLRHSYPGCWTGTPNVLSVGSINNRGQLSSFSDRGERVDLVAPGEDIYSITNREEVVTQSTVHSMNPLNETFETVPSGGIPSGWTRFGNNPGVSSGMLDMDMNYPLRANNTTAVATPIINLSGYDFADIGFIVSCDTEPAFSTWYDYVEVRISSDSGNTYPFLLGRYDETMIDLLNNAGGGSFVAGYQFVYQQFRVPSYMLTSGFRVRMEWYSDFINTNHDGCLFEGFAMFGQKTTTTTTTNFYDYEYSDGTSYAAPYVAAAAALIYSNNLSYSGSDVASIIKNNTEILPGVNPPHGVLNVKKALLAEINTSHYILLSGEETEIIAFGANYIDKGARFVDGSATGALTPSGSVNTQRPGVHRLTYTHSGSTGTLSRIRKVLVLPRDVSGDIFIAEITRAMEIGAIGGYPDGSFGSNNRILRSEVAAILVRALGYSNETISQEDIRLYGFGDVPSNHWAFKDIILARKHGIVAGKTASTFDPETFVTRGEIATMISRKLPAYPGVLNPPFADSVGHWAVSDIQKVHSFMIVNGFSPTSFGPNSNATRGQFSKILINALFVVKNQVN